MVGIATISSDKIIITDTTDQMIITCTAIYAIPTRITQDHIVGICSINNIVTAASNKTTNTDTHHQVIKTHYTCRIDTPKFRQQFKPKASETT